MRDPIVLIHGALGDGRQLGGLQRVLAPRSTHLIELEGHGATSATTPNYSIERFADQVREMFASQHIERAAFFGYSMGGYVALYLAANSPSLVTRVATLGTKLAWTPDAAARETSRLDPATIRTKVPKFAEALEHRHAGAGGWESVLANTAALMRELGEHPQVDDALLARIQQPVRLMVGDRDTVVSIDETAAAARKLAHGELAVLPATPHPYEQAHVKLLTSALIDFFDAE